MALDEMADDNQVSVTAYLPSCFINKICFNISKLMNNDRKLIRPRNICLLLFILINGVVATAFSAYELYSSLMNYSF